MTDIELVSRCLDFISSAAKNSEVTIKHRIGLGKEINEDYLHKFVSSVHKNTGCKVFIVHARNAYLEGLSPKDNRTIPPLRYDLVNNLKSSFNNLQIIINGGITSVDFGRELLDYEISTAGGYTHLDGVMIGRSAYHDTYNILKNVDRVFYKDNRLIPTRLEVLQEYANYLKSHKHSASVSRLLSPTFGIVKGMVGSALFRRYIAENLKTDAGTLLLEASKFLSETE